MFGKKKKEKKKKLSKFWTDLLTGLTEEEAERVRGKSTVRKEINMKATKIEQLSN